MTNTDFSKKQMSKFESILNNFSLKKLKVVGTSDGSFIKTDLYFKNKLFTEFYDEGNGGGARPINFNTEVGKEVILFIEEQGLRELVLEDYNEDSDSFKIEDINNHTIIEFIVYTLVDKAETEKQQKLLLNKSKKILMYYNEKGELFNIKWKNIKSFEDLASQPKGLLSLQQNYDKTAEKLRKNGAKFLTPAQSLSSVGVKVDLSLHTH